MDDRNKAVLATIEDSIDVFFAKREGGTEAWKNGVSAREVQGLVSLGASIPDPFAGFKLNPIPEADSGCFNLPEDIDKLASRCLEGAATSDGGGVGVPVVNEGKGACFWIALASGALNTRCSTGGAALALRTGAMRMALLKCEEFLSADGYLAEYRSGDLFDTKEHDMVMKLAGRVWPMNMSADVARLYYLCAIRSNCGPFKYSQQAVLPWAAEVLGLKVRVFHPAASVSLVGGKWNKKY
ncbi:unnamed protein product, partial [Ectocarpus sp. 13 AM-2016]